MDREARERRRDVFLGGAEDYRAARPGYPARLLEAAVELGGLEPGDRLLEVGCGTGEATTWFAERGYVVLAMDRSPDMVHLAAARLAPFPSVDVVCRDFEADTPDGRWDALVAATSYHWLDPATRGDRCAGVLAPGGALVLLWHTHPRPFEGYFERSRTIYERLVPGWKPPATPGMAEEGIRGIVTELEATEAFSTVERASRDWRRTYDRDLYLRLLGTYSDHRLLGPAVREALFTELADLIDREFGGRVERPYRSELVVARRR